jgi:hypothetical protein
MWSRRRSLQWVPVVTRMDLPGDDGDRQCRYLEAAVNGVLIASIYAPNGNPQPGPKFDYKLAWLKRLNAHAAELYATGAPVVLGGDYNVVPTDLDIYPTKSWELNALLQPKSRAAYQDLLAQGWTDAIRALHPKEPLYTFWDYKRKRWERDAGRHAVPARLAAVDGMISRLPDCFRRKLAVCDFEFLKAHDVGLGFAKPVQQVAQTTVDVVDIKTGDLHRHAEANEALPFSVEVPALRFNDVDVQVRNIDVACAQALWR